MKILTNIPFILEIEVLKKKLHIKSNSGYVQCLEDIIQAVREVGNPKAVLKESYIDSRIDDNVIIDNVRFTGKVLRNNLDKIERVFPYVATCGTELDNIKINSDDLLEEYILDSIKEILLRESVVFLDKYIYKRYDIQKIASMNPGSSDLFVWPIEQQKELFSLFPDIENSIGVKLTESCLMIPNKSVSGIKFPDETDFHNCRLCKKERCPTRVEPFDEKLLKATIDSI